MKELVVDGACVDVQVMIFIVEIADDLLEPRWWMGLELEMEVVGHVYRLR